MEASSVSPIALGASCHRSWGAWSYFTIRWTFVLRLCSTNLFALILLGPLFAAAPNDSDDAAKKTQQYVKRRFGKDLLANFGGLFAPSNIGPWIAGAAATGLATIPEQDIKEHFTAGDRWGRWSSPGQYMGNSSILVVAAGGLFWAGRKSDNSRFRDATYSLMQATIVNVAVTRAVKVTTDRQRPNGGEFSFPSGHASTTFMWATVFSAQPRSDARRTTTVEAKDQRSQRPENARGGNPQPEMKQPAWPTPATPTKKNSSSGPFLTRDSGSPSLPTSNELISTGRLIA